VSDKNMEFLFGLLTNPYFLPLLKKADPNNTTQNLSATANPTPVNH
jgi:hypothetical protein